MRLRTRRQRNKRNHLPPGISCTWRQRPGRRPYFEFQAKCGPRILHFYVGVEPTFIRTRLALLRAIACRRAFELSIEHWASRIQRAS